MNSKSYTQLVPVITVLLVVSSICVLLVVGIVMTRRIAQKESNTNADNSIVNTQSPTITVSTLPVYLIIKPLVSDEYTVALIADGAADVHTFEPTSQDVQNILSSKVFVYSSELDHWAEDVATQARKNGVEVILFSDFVSVMESHEDSHDKNQESDADKDDNNNMTKENAEHHDDPHFWLDPILVRTIVEQLALSPSSLGESEYPVFTTLIDRNSAQRLYTDLSMLDRDIQNSLQSCEYDTVVISHDFLDYMSERYGFKTLALAGMESTDSLAPQELATIIETIKTTTNTPKRYVLVEADAEQPAVDALIASVQDTVTIDRDTIYSLESGDSTRSYISSMNSNRIALAKALGCS